MQFSQYYALIYQSDIQAHEMLSLSKAEALGRNVSSLFKGSSEDQRRAEHLLNMMEFDSKSISNMKQQLGRTSIEVESLISNELQHVHESCSEEIRSKWQRPEMSDEELDSFLYNEIMSEHFEKLPSHREFEIRIG